jgi:hypothetical protein
MSISGKATETAKGVGTVVGTLVGGVLFVAAAAIAVLAVKVVIVFAVIAVNIVFLFAAALWRALI